MRRLRGRRRTNPAGAVEAPEDATAAEEPSAPGSYQVGASVARPRQQTPQSSNGFQKPVVDYNQDIGPSADPETPGDVLITDEMLEHARAICDEEAEADLVAVAAVAQFEMGWEDITRRAIPQGTLSAIGLAGLSLEYLGKYSKKIDENIIYWKRREAMVDALTKKLLEEQARVAQDAVLLVEVKNTVITKSHKLAKQQQTVYAANQDNSVSASSAVGHPAPPSSSVQQLRQKLYDSKRRSNPLNGRPTPSGFCGVRPISGSATSLSLNYAAPPPWGWQVHLRPISGGAA